MTVEISSIVLLNIERGEPEAAELWDAITESQLSDWEAEWVPETFKAVQKLHRMGVERRLWPQSRHWNWREKVTELQGLLGARGFSIMCDGLTQGMMTLNMGSKRCRLESQRGQHLIYIDYLENAPWNRKELMNGAPRYRGVGSIFIRTAIEVSRIEGFKGRIGLHALPQSESFYGNTCGMTEFGKDSNYQNLSYFEMTPEQATQFIQKGDSL